MAKTEKDTTYLGTFLSTGLYKRNAGRLARQLTAAAILIIVAIGAWRLSESVLADMDPMPRYAITAVVALVGAWAAYRLVNHPPFADFLIDVELEMVKVSWPSKDETWRATGVVVTTMFLLSFVLFGYDVIWQQILRWIRVLEF